MDKLRPGWIERKPKNKDYFESRISFLGNHKVLPKLGDKLFHYINSDGEMFKGFYPDNFSAGAKLFYDPTGDGERISNTLNYKTPQADFFTAMVKNLECSRFFKKVFFFFFNNFLYLST
jgi:hypothetical protein